MTPTTAPRPCICPAPGNSELQRCRCRTAGTQLRAPQRDHDYWCECRRLYPGEHLRVQLGGRSSLYSSFHAPVFARASDRFANQLAFRHSSRSFQWKLSTYAFCAGRPGSMCTNPIFRSSPHARKRRALRPTCARQSSPHCLDIGQRNIRATWSIPPIESHSFKGGLLEALPAFVCRSQVVPAKKIFH
jgi:hypothetical protein